MNEYRIAVPKGDIQGFAQDPNQQIANAQGANLTAPLTVKNTINIGVTAVYGKKVINSGFKAIVGQIGSSRLEQGIEVGSKILTYGGLAIVNLPLAVLAVTADVAVNAIDNAVASHEVSLENERKIQERGTLIQLGAGDYFG